MAYKFNTYCGDWTDLRGEGVLEIDGYHPDGEDDHAPHYERMQNVYDGVFEILREAREQGYEAVLFRHGHSTSRRGKTTSRSQIRKAMRSPGATPFVDRARSVQHPSVFLVRLKGGG